MKTTPYLNVYVVSRDDPIEIAGSHWRMGPDRELVIWGAFADGASTRPVVATFAPGQWIAVEDANETLEGPYTLRQGVLHDADGEHQIDSTDVYIVLDQEATYP